MRFPSTVAAASNIALPCSLMSIALFLAGELAEIFLGGLQIRLPRI